MTKDEFLDSFYGAPYSLEKVAGIVREITDFTALALAGREFLAAQKQLEEALDEVGFEFG